MSDACKVTPMICIVSTKYALNGQPEIREGGLWYHREGATARSNTSK